MKNYWYVAKNDEVFIDLDGDKPNRLVTVLARIRGLMEANSFAIKEVWMFPSRADNHFHIVLKLEVETSLEVRTALQLYCFSDIFRTCNNLIRRHFKVSAPDILISSLNWRKNFHFYRTFNYSCGCSEKHDHRVMRSCAAALSARGLNRYDIYLEKPVPPEDFFMKRFGKITIDDN
jgi:hypothetical protein